jgi:hypothetical protein
MLREQIRQQVPLRSCGRLGCIAAAFYPSILSLTLHLLLYNKYRNPSDLPKFVFMLTITNPTTDEIDLAIPTSGCSSNKAINSDRVCEKCATIPSDALFVPEKSCSSKEQVFEFEGSLDEEAQCRICQLFAGLLNLIMVMPNTGGPSSCVAGLGLNSILGFRRHFLNVNTTILRVYLHTCYTPSCLSLNQSLRQSKDSWSIYSLAMDSLG